MARLLRMITSRTASNKALQRRPRSTVLMHSLSAVRGPAERRRWAPFAQLLMSEVAHARNLVRCATRPCGYRQMQGQAPHRRSTGNRHYQDGIVLERLLAVERMR